MELIRGEICVIVLVTTVLEKHTQAQLLAAGESPEGFVVVFGCVSAVPLRFLDGHQRRRWAGTPRSQGVLKFDMRPPCRREPLEPSWGFSSWKTPLEKTSTAREQRREAWTELGFHLLYLHCVCKCVYNIQRHAKLQFHAVLQTDTESASEKRESLWMEESSNCLFEKVSQS